jgi:nucleoside-diphosphate-sugar epimerase
VRIAVIGAAGFAGRAILAGLQERHQVRAFDRGPEAWVTWRDLDGDWSGGEVVHGDVASFEAVDRALDGVDAAIHTAAYALGQPYEDEDPLPFLVNLKGLWNVLESARRRGLRRVVHIGSCQTVHHRGLFFSAEVRRPDGTPYAVTKRLQEEMCRQMHEAWGLPIIVLRTDYIVDGRLGIGRAREKLGPGDPAFRPGWVCRHDLAEACRLAAENATIPFDVLHLAGSTEADASCNSAHAREILGLEYRGNVERFR